MPKPPPDIPENLRVYFFHGLDLQYRSGDKQALGDCPFCGKSKFSVEISTSLFRCLSCNEGTETGKSFQGGNSLVFIRKLWELSDQATGVTDYKELALDRKLLYPDTVSAWEVAKSITTRDWLVPGYNAEGKIITLSKYVENREGKKILLATPTLRQGLFGVSLLDPNKPIVYLCEGIWDGMALWEVLGVCKESEDKLVPTANKEASLLGSANVLAVPGCQTFFESWLPLFAGKIVNLLYDNDHEKVRCSNCRKPYSKYEHEKCPNCSSVKADARLVAPVALENMKRVAGILSKAKSPPSEINYLRWSAESGFDPSLSSGFDIRDALNA